VLLYKLQPKPNMKPSFLFFFLLSFQILQAQNFAIGHRTETLIDASRNNREIPVEVYYPALITGDDAAFATGAFPLVSFGHGFAMGVDVYTNITDYFVPKGFIFLMVNTETSLFSPSHPDFGLDLNFALSAMQAKGVLSASPYFGKISDKTAIMGHSMGGGAAVLAAAANQTLNALILMAPAVTNPSSITAAPQATAPAIVFSGDGDAVVTPTDAHVPIFNGLNATCKHFISILGGGHCYYGNSAPFTCDLGETVSGSTINITREQQQSIFYDFALPMMELNLKNDASNWESFKDSLQNSPRINSEINCPDDFAGINYFNSKDILIFPQPAHSQLEVVLPNNGNVSGIYELWNSVGQKINSETAFISNTFSISLEDLPAGIYVFVLENNRARISKRFIVMH
jgi:hypothetical protein